MLDSYTIKDLETRYSKARSNIYGRIDGLKELGYNLEPEKVLGRSIYNSEQVALLDLLDEHLQQQPGATIASFPRADAETVLQDTPKLSRVSQDSKPSQTELMMAVLGQLVQNSQSSQPIDPLKSHRELQEAADNKWLLDSAQLCEILGRKSLPSTSFTRGSWQFERSGNIGGRSAWLVTRS